ncbi:MAG: YitT family protein [Flavobacteriales bacterium]
MENHEPSSSAIGVAAWLLSLESALYSIITYLVAYKTVDFLIEGIEEYLGVKIISPHYTEIHAVIQKRLRRGVTVYSGRRGIQNFEKTQEVQILYTVITRLEINRLNTLLKKIDPNAFVVMSSVRDTRGGMIKKCPLHHD